MIKNVLFRPSQVTLVKRAAARLSKDDQEIGVKIAELEMSLQAISNNNQLTVEDRLKILDLASEILQYRYTHLELEQSDYSKRFTSISNEKKELGDDTSKITYLDPLPPDKGHDQSKFGFGLGYRRDSFFTEVDFRPAYHGFNDSDVGFIKGSEINIFDSSVRYYEKTDSFKLQKLHLIDIDSLVPRELIFKPISWNFNTGFEQQFINDGGEHLGYFLNLGGGIAYETTILGLYYFLLQADVRLNDKYNDKTAIGPSQTVGMLKKVNDFWNINVQAQLIRHLLGENDTYYKVTLGQNFRLNKNSSFNLYIGTQRDFDKSWPEINVLWNIYF